MPFHTSFDEQLLMMRASFAGVVGEEDFLKAFDELRAEPRNHVEIPDLIDFDGVADITASVNTIRDLAQECLLGKTARMAINAPQDFAYGVARMYIAMRTSGDREIAIFRSRPEAEDWIAAGPSKIDA